MIMKKEERKVLEKDLIKSFGAVIKKRGYEIGSRTAKTVKSQIKILLKKAGKTLTKKAAAKKKPVQKKARQ